MAYTFECGSCHAIYKLDENQITQKGVKITCPKCLAYFILKKGIDTNAKSDSAYIEYVMDDGIRTLETTKSFPPKPPASQFDKDAKTQKIPTIPQSHLREPQIGSKIKSMRIESAEAPYPTLKKKKNKAMSYFLVIFIIVAAIILLYWKIL